MGKIVRTPQAETDIIDIWFYIAVENKNQLNANRFMDKIEEKLYFLANNPTIGKSTNEYLPGLHQFVFGNYLIYYFPLPKNSGIEVVRIVHGARDIPQLFEE